MLDTFPAALIIGTVLGVLAGLGTGGGSILILWLTLVLGMDAGQAKAINLLFFLPSAFISCILRRKNRNLPIQKVLPAIIAGSTTAAIFAVLSSGWNVETLRKPFGILLLFTGIHELMYTPKRSK